MTSWYLTEISRINSQSFTVTWSIDLKGFVTEKFYHDFCKIYTSLALWIFFYITFLLFFFFFLISLIQVSHYNFRCIIIEVRYLKFEISMYFIEMKNLKKKSNWNSRYKILSKLKNIIDICNINLKLIIKLVGDLLYTLVMPFNLLI